MNEQIQLCLTDFTALGHIAILYSQPHSTQTIGEFPFLMNLSWFPWVRNAHIGWKNNQITFSERSGLEKRQNNAHGKTT